MDFADSSFSQSHEITALIAELKKNLSENDAAGPAARRHLKEIAERLSLALETPGETVQRVAYYVSTLSQIYPPQKKNPRVSVLHRTKPLILDPCSTANADNRHSHRQ